MAKVTRTFKYYTYGLEFSTPILFVRTPMETCP